ncbi:hypothetical protein EYC59_00380 [Candidatus Saccharibacteria bacterium]|nr:MAG: hypothetical protein EYC59_00380 [Candidatus Saccharibacteria bacterium]
MNSRQTPPSVESIQLPGDHAGKHPDPTVREEPPEVFSTSLSDAATRDAEGRTLINPVPNSVEGLPEAANVTWVKDPHTGASRFVVGRTVETGYRPPAPVVTPATLEPTSKRKSRRGLFVTAGIAAVAVVAGGIAWLSSGGKEESQDSQGDTKASSQAGATIAGATAPAEATTATATGAPAETGEATAEKSYTIDTVAANADPKAYYAAYASQLGMEYADNSNLDKYFALSDAGKNGEVDQQTASSEMEAFLNEQLGNNLNQFANALYQNPKLTPKEQADLTAQLAPYVFDTENNPQLETAVRQFAGKIVAAAPAGGTLQGYFAPGSSQGVETTTFLGVLRLDENGQPDNNFIGPELDDESGKTLYLVGRPGFTDSSATSHLSLRQVSPQG